MSEPRTEWVAWHKYKVLVDRIEQLEERLKVEQACNRCHHYHGKDPCEDVAELEAKQKWQPIESEGEFVAPADEDIILGWWEEWPKRKWCQKIGFARSSSGGWVSGVATHWMHKLGPPKPGGVE